MKPYGEADARASLIDFTGELAITGRGREYQTRELAPWGQLLKKMGGCS
jgi:hypothetical protein